MTHKFTTEEFCADSIFHLKFNTTIKTINGYLGFKCILLYTAIRAVETNGWYNTETLNLTDH